MSETDLLEEIEYLKSELYKGRIERTRLKRQIDDLTSENKDLRTLNAEYTQLLADKPISRSKLQETIRIQADQIAGLQHDLEVQRITSKSFTEEQLQPAKRGRPRTIPDGIREQVKDLHEQGCSVRKIAELLGVSVGFTQKAIKQTV